MFNINSKPMFEATVKLAAVAAPGAEPPSFRATYRALLDDETEKFDRATMAGLIDFLRAVIVKIDDLVDDNNQPVAYSEALRDELLKRQYMRAALMHGYFDAIVGARLGN